MVQKPATTRIPRQLVESDTRGKGAAEIGWGTHGDFDRCRIFAHAHGIPEHMIDGFCANLHRIATGEWPGPNAHKGRLASAAVITLTAAMTHKAIPWRGPLAPIGVPTGDGRSFPAGILKYQSFPMPLRWQEQGSRGHDGAVTIGVIQGAREKIVDGKPVVFGYGYFLDPDVIPQVNKALHQVENGVTGPSVDLDSYTASLQDHLLTGKKIAVLSEGRMRAATLVPIPAFADLRIELGEPGTSFADQEEPAGDGWSVSQNYGIGDWSHFAVNGDTWHKAPIAPREALFDADDAVSRIEAWANGDPAKMASAFLWVNDQNGPLLGRQGYRLPWGDIVDGQPHLIYHAIYAAAALLQDAHGGLPNIPEGEKMKLRSVISEIYKKLATEYGDPSIQAPWDRQDAQAAAEVEEFDAGMDEWCDCDCVECQLIDSDTFDIANLEEFLGRYTESKHPRDPRHNKHAGEWVDVPGHGPHGQILMAGKWVYPPKKGGRGHARVAHEPRHAAGETKARKPGEGYRYHGKRRYEDAAAEQKRRERIVKGEEPPKKAPEKSEVKVAKKVPAAKKAVAKKEPVHKPEPKKEPEAPIKRAAPEKQAAAHKAAVRVAKKGAAGHQLTAAQQKALEANAKDPGHGFHPATRKVLEREGYLDPKDGRLTKKALDHLGIDKQREDRPGTAKPKEKGISAEDRKVLQQIHDKGDLHRGNNAPPADYVQAVHRLQDSGHLEAVEVGRAKLPGGHVEVFHDLRLTEKGRKELGIESKVPAKKAVGRAAVQAPKVEAKKFDDKDVEQAVRDKVAAEYKKGGDNHSDLVGLAAVRDALDEKGVPRDQQDRVLKAMARQEDVRILPIANRKALNERDHKAALKIGVEDNHAIEIGGNERRDRNNAREQAAREAQEAQRKAPQGVAAAKKAVPAKRVPKGENTRAEAAKKHLDVLGGLDNRVAAKQYIKDQKLQRQDLLDILDADVKRHNEAGNGPRLPDRAGGRGDNKAALEDRVVQIVGQKADAAAIFRGAQGGGGQRKATPAPAKKAAAAAPEAKIEAGKYSAKAKKANNWGGGEKEGMHQFHPDGAIGVAIDNMGKDGALDVDGDRLDNRLGDIATDVVEGRISPMQGLDRYKKLRDRLPDGRAKAALDSAIKDMEPPKWDDAKVAGILARAIDAPAPLRNLITKLLGNPLARGNKQATRGRPNHVSEVDKLDQLIQDWHEGKVTKIRAARVLRNEIFNQHHESNEGKVPLDRAVADALKQLDEMGAEEFKKPAASVGLKVKAKAAEAPPMRHDVHQARVKALRAEVRKFDRQIKKDEDDIAAGKDRWLHPKMRANIERLKKKRDAANQELAQLNAIPQEKLDKSPRQALDPKAKDLGDAYAAGQAQAARKAINAGVQGKKERVTLPDGRIIFSKDLGARGLFPGHDGIAEADGEELASLMGRAFGAPTPVVHRQGPHHVLMDWVDGKTFAEARQADVRAAMATDEYRLMRVLDILTNNGDRHHGNIMVAGGKPYAIDNGLAWSSLARSGAGKSVQELARETILRRGGETLSREDYKRLKTKLEDLRPAFRARGRERWLDFSLAVVQELANRGHGQQSFIRD